MKLINAIGATVLTGMFAFAWADTPPPASSASPPPPKAAMAGACKQDMQTLCPGIQPGEGRVAACMKTHFKMLSPGCKEAIKENRREHAAPAGPDSPPPPASPPPH